MNPFTAITAAFAIGLMPLDQSTSPQDVVVRGRVLENFQQHPIPGAVVYAVSDTDFQATTTDSTGHFYFLTLLPGNYRLVGQAPGYLVSCICCLHHPVELDAGYEYDATIWLPRACY